MKYKFFLLLFWFVARGMANNLRVSALLLIGVCINKWAFPPLEIINIFYFFFLVVKLFAHLSRSSSSPPSFLFPLFPFPLPFPCIKCPDVPTHPTLCPLRLQWTRPHSSEPLVCRRKQKPRELMQRSMPKLKYVLYTLWSKLLYFLILVNLCRKTAIT